MQRKNENYKLNEVECECMYMKNLKKGPDAKERLYKKAMGNKNKPPTAFNKI